MKQRKGKTSSRIAGVKKTAPHSRRGKLVSTLKKAKANTERPKTIESLKKEISFLVFPLMDTPRPRVGETWRIVH
jgi:hypothetical protein